MSGAEQQDVDPKGRGRSRGRPAVFAVVLVVATAWVASLLWVGSFSVAPQVGGTATTSTSATSLATEAPTPTVTVSVAVPPTATVFVTATVKVPVQAPPMGVLDSTGVGAIQLGMSYQAAIDTGLLTKDSRTIWFLVDHPKAEVCMSKANGVMAIFADQSAVSPEGIHLGSTLTQVKAAYPSMIVTPDGYLVSLTDTSRYTFLFGTERGAQRVREWNLHSTNQTCFG